MRGACPHDCPDTCALHVTVENGRAIKVEGDPDHPTTRGVLCTKVARYLERTYSDQRVLHPLRRVGAKGEAKFERITWDDALTTIASRFSAIAASDDGPQAILPYSYAGTMGLLNYGSMDRRFFHKLGASLLDRTICASAGKAGYAATIGASIGTDIEQFENAKLIIIWGSNPIVSNLHLWSRVQEAKRHGATLIAIDPYRSLTAEKCHRHLALLPGTDAALALGMMNVLIAEHLTDDDYIARFTLGFEQLKARASEYPPQRVAAITGLTTDEIVALARDYGTIKPSVIRLNYGMQRHAGGGMAMRTAACLPALVGAWRDAAGGALLSSSGTYPVNTRALERPDLIWNNPRTINMSAIGDALLYADRIQPIRALYVYNSNPVAVAPDSSQVIAGFSRPGLFCVVHDLFLTDTANYADIVLPATSQLEQLDVHASYGHLYALANNPAIAPLGEAKPNTEVFRLLAQRMGFTGRMLRRYRRRHRAHCIQHRGSARERARLGQTQGGRLAAAQRARALRAFRRGQLSHAVGQVRVLLGDLGETRPRSVADLHAASRIRGRKSDAGEAVSTRDAVATGATRHELDVRQSSGVSRRRKIAATGDASGRRGSARHRHRRSRAHPQRSRFVSADGRCNRQGATRRRGCAVDMVAKAVAGRRQCQPGDGPGLDRHGSRRDVLRCAGGSRANDLVVDASRRRPSVMRR